MSESVSRRRLVVVAHDAGGAEIVSSWLRRHLDEWEPTLVLGGPAVKVFARKLGDDMVFHADLPALDGVAFVLCGSSGAANLERQAVRSARSAGVPCAVWLDHWINYAMRFELDGATVLPDEVWVCDEHAAALALTELPGADIRLKGNPYLEDFAAEVHALEGPRDADAERILYVTEPNAVAFDALARYLDYLAGHENGTAELRLRTHPAEPADKYDALLARRPGRLSTGATLAEDVAWADTVVGCDTMAMFAALHAGRRVISVLPPGMPAHLPADARIERLWK
jgi:hypothetical protein